MVYNEDMIKPLRGRPLTNKEKMLVKDGMDLQDIKKVLDDFMLLTGLEAIFTNGKGEIVAISDQSEVCSSFCRLIRSDPEGLKRCVQSMDKAGRQAAELGEAYIYRCHAGVIKFTAPVMSDTTYIGSISSGSVLMWDWDEIALQEIFNQTKDLKVNKEALVVASRQIKVLSSKKVQGAAKQLFIVASHLDSSGLDMLKERKELNDQQSKLFDFVYQNKIGRDPVRLLESQALKCSYPMDKENELLCRVRLGDRTGAKAILNEILGHIFLGGVTDIELLKARILELVVVISRAAVEGGASLEKLLGLNYEFIADLSAKKNFDEICLWIVKVLDVFMDTVYETRNIKNARSIVEALKFIRENYKKNLTLESVAQQVYISPYYLSHLFKEELGITFVEYLTKVRIDEAKRLLKDSSMSIVAIALEVGYQDASYFSKVFKKVVGLSPNQYRKNLS